MYKVYMLYIIKVNPTICKNKRYDDVIWCCIWKNIYNYLIYISLNTNHYSYLYVDFSQNIFLLSDLEITVRYAALKFDIKRNANVCGYHFIIYPRANENHKLGINSQYFW